jgi:glycosyltransferase involved in cell wall biosynthesis
MAVDADKRLTRRSSRERGPAAADERSPVKVCMLLHRSVAHDSRVRREAATLVGAGHDVTVLELEALRVREERLDGFRRRSALPAAWVRRTLPFATYRLVFLATFVIRGRALRPDVVHAHDAAMLLPAALIARLTRARLVYDSHELATGVEYRSGGWERLVHQLEAAIVPRCAAVITVSDGIADRLQVRYGLRARPTVLRNVSDLAAPGPADGTRLRARLGIARAEPLVLHQGSAASGRGCEVLIRAVAAMPGVHLALLGAAEDSNAGELVALARAEAAAERVHVLPSVALEELLAHTAEADVGVSLLADSCENHRLALPNKLFEYIAAGVPVVTSALPELERLVLGRAIGWTVDPAEPADVRRGLARALAAREDDALDTRLEAAGRELCWPVERTRLLKLYERLERDERENVRNPVGRGNRHGNPPSSPTRRGWRQRLPG